MSERSQKTSDPSRTERSGLIERLRSLFGSSQGSARHDIEDVLADTSTDEFSSHERSMLRNVLTLHELRVRDIMVPRADVVAVALDDSLSAVLALFRTAGHSRLPVHGQTLDDQRGMIHIRDFLDYLARNAEVKNGLHIPERDAIEQGDGRALEMDASSGANLGVVDLSVPLSQANIIRQVLYAPPSMPVLDLLVRMQAARIHMALVIDEYGGTDGLVSIEDVVEVIVGDIEDEHDDEELPKIEKVGDEVYVIDARASLEDATSAVDLNIDDLEDAEDVDTVGGLVATLAGRVPARGEIIAAGDIWEFEVLDADPRRVKRVRLRRSPVKDAPPIVDSGI